MNPAANPLSPGAPSDAKNLPFRAYLASLARSSNLELSAQKIFSSIAQFEQSSKKYFVEISGVDRVRDALDLESSHRIACKKKR
jgi:hypothetical protein